MVRFLQQLGYEVVRQRGSHVRLWHAGPPGHALTVPLGKSLRTGTLHAIVSEIAARRGVTVGFLAERL